MTVRPGLVVLAPIAPSRAGNGLAMRVEAMIEAATVHHDVHLVVVPVAGASPVSASRVTVTSRIEISPLRDGGEVATSGWLADEVWRERLSRLAPLPDLVARVPLDLAGTVPDRVGEPSIAGVLAIRLTTSLAGLRLSERLGVPLVLDLDDDDEDLATQLDEPELAASWHRMATLVLPLAGGVFAASDGAASTLSDRHGLGRPVETVPNAAPRAPDVVPPRPNASRALMIANFGYRPNAEGAAWFLDEVVPHLSPVWTVDLVGPGSDQLASGRQPRVRAGGVVEDLSSAYAATDVVVVPLLTGSGTRIKVLEAFAHQRPVVATSVALDGLGAIADVHALVADDPSTFAEAMVACGNAQLASHLVRHARHLVATTYDRSLVIRRTAARLAAAFRTGDPTTEPMQEPGP